MAVFHNKKKIITAVALLLILSFMLVSIPEIGIVKAESTIYNRTDGRVEGTDKIQRIGNIYAFIDDLFDSIVVEKDDVVIDGRNSPRSSHSALVPPRGESHSVRQILWLIDCQVGLVLNRQ